MATITAALAEPSLQSLVKGTNATTNKVSNSNNKTPA